MNPFIQNIIKRKEGSIALLLLVFFLLPSCTEKLDWELEYREADVIVVEARITSEVKAHEVRLTRPVYDMFALPEPVSGAVVEINDARVIHRLTEDPDRPGVYLTERNFSGEVGKGYQLRIGYGDRRITAVAFMREASPFPDMRLYRVQQQPPLFEVYITDQNGPSVIRMELDWSHVRGYDTLPGADNHALIYHYTLESIDVNRMFPPDRERVYFPPGTIVYREKESVSRSYEEFLRGMLSETDWRGGVFDVLPGNARTNLSEGAIGFFTACDIIRDTIIIE